MCRCPHSHFGQMWVWNKNINSCKLFWCRLLVELQIHPSMPTSWYSWALESDGTCPGSQKVGERLIKWHKKSISSFMWVLCKTCFVFPATLQQCILQNWKKVGFILAVNGAIANQQSVTRTKLSKSACSDLFRKKNLLSFVLEEKLP